MLLQPQPRLQDILPDLTSAAQHQRLPNLDAAFVGLVEESGSLYAMSPDRFPLVVFGDSNEDARHLRSIDPPPGSVFDPTFDYDRDLPTDVESVKRLAKARRLRQSCQNGSLDVRCLTGVKKLGSDSQSRLSRLLDDTPAALPPLSPSPAYNTADTALQEREEPLVPSPMPENNSVHKSTGWANGSEPSRLDDRPPAGLLGMSGSTQAFSAFALCAIALLVWMSVRKFFSSPQRLVDTAPARSSSDVSEDALKSVIDEPPMPQHNGDAKVPDGHAELSPPLLSEEPERPSTPGTHSESPQMSLDALEPVDGGGVTTDAAEGEDSEKEGDTPDTPGKRKGVRRKRGKKKKGTVTIVIPSEEAEQAAPTATLNANDSAEAPRATPTVPSIVLAPSTPPLSTAPTLVVSDTVLGKQLLHTIRHYDGDTS